MARRVMAWDRKINHRKLERPESSLPSDFKGMR